MTAVLRLVLVLALLLGVAACGDDDDGGDGDGGDSAEPAGDGENKLTVTERDYEFEVAGEVQAGTLSIAVSNEGAELHEIAMAKLVEGKTLDDVRATLEAASEEEENVLEGVAEDDAVIDDLGGAQLPGTSYTITGSGIEPGDYALICFIPTAEGQPHFSLGMLAEFTVAEGDAGDGPDADVTYTATDDELEGPDQLEAGETTIEVANRVVRGPRDQPA